MLLVKIDRNTLYKEEWVILCKLYNVHIREKIKSFLRVINSGIRELDYICMALI